VIERRAVLLVAAQVALFVFVANVPGDLGRIGLYEQRQVVAETRLVLNGWLPWRDVVVVHGLLGDAVPSAVDAIDPGHMITFDTLASSPAATSSLVSSCQQWRGYGSSPFFLVSTPPQEIGGVRLIR
jgi:hypothetical protein